MSKFNTAKQYLDSIPKQTKPFINNIIKYVKRKYPSSELILNYQILAFKLNKNRCYLAGYEKHIALYPIPKGDKEFNKSIKPYVSGKSTLKFDISQEIPYDLIYQIVERHLEK